MKNSISKIGGVLVLTAVSLTGMAQTKAKPKVSTVKSPVAIQAKKEVKLSSNIDSVSYAVGVLVAQNFKSQQVTLNHEQVAKGFESVMKNSAQLMDVNTCQSVVNSFMMKNQEKMQAEEAKKFEPNRLEGEKWLAANAKKQGIVTTASGLQYEIIKAGDGPKPTANDKVKTHYHGTLIDGTVFDSSVNRGEPVTFPVGGVIPGWVEALQLMPVGSKWKLYIPQNLAYGARAAGEKIKPYTALVFEVELLSIEK
ncbi:FKBP-type peptidyl-prolyl cis-trans isomerase [Sandaracinomonas limnophila]|nr:FKBP-type peptidyl-prolyl cis-trans isomerase [Sandaracinomonas limnophila]